MIDKVNEMGDVKPFVKQGFFDYRKIEEIFTNQKVKVADALNSEKKGCELVNLLTEIFKNVVPRPKQSMNDILSLIEQADKPGRFDEKQLNDIVEGLR